MSSSAAPVLAESAGEADGLAPSLDENADGASARALAVRNEPSSSTIARPRLRLVRSGEHGTTTAEYTVVTAAAVAFGALLLKLLTGGWGAKILETAFRGVIKMLGF